MLSVTEKIKQPVTEREFLTTNDVKRLIETPIAKSATNVKAAFLFCCFCGLRFSDVRALQWSDIYVSDGRAYLKVVQQKTKEPLIVPLSEQAKTFLPDKNGQDGSVFSLPTYKAVWARVNAWAKDSGLKKSVTFHTSRHTFATMMLTAGADLYTTSKLLGHSKISTTEIYAKIVDAKKVEAVNLLSNLF